MEVAMDLECIGLSPRMMGSRCSMWASVEIRQTSRHGASSLEVPACLTAGRNPRRTVTIRARRTILLKIVSVIVLAVVLRHLVCCTILSIIAFLGSLCFL